ncbi:recombinase family protein [Paenibacillus sp. NRS-1760]|uniref:recombinase family protein n=1 Tax=Paenibacillus sp. NRS-1760 TaxID=3233902 RepID=UPI003D2E399E
MAIKRVAIYCRKSREADDKTTASIDGQANSLIELCEKCGYEYDLYSETGSSQEWDRPEFQKLLSKIKHYEYDAIVCTEQSRLTRNTKHYEEVKEIMIKSGCILVTPTSMTDYTNEDQMFSGDIIALIEKREWQTTRKRLMRGSRESAKKGNWMGKKVPLGYQYNRDTKNLEIVPEDAEIIVRMFNEYVSGKSTTTIAYDFTNAGITTMQWSSSSVARMISNIVYAGHSSYGRTKQYKQDGKRVTERTSTEDQILIKDAHKPIVPQDLFDMAQRIRNERNSRPAALKIGKHIFSGLVRCGGCGSIHSFQTAHGKKRITSCTTRTYKDDGTYIVCTNGGVYVDDFKTLFHEYFAQYVDQLEQYAHLMTDDEIQNFDEEIKRREKQIEKLNKDIKRVQQGFVMEIFTPDEARKQIASYKEQIATLEEQIGTMTAENNISEHDKVSARLENMKRFLIHGDNIPENEANDILREFIDTIIYTKDGNEINLKIIMKE